MNKNDYVLAFEKVAASFKKAESPEDLKLSANALASLMSAYGNHIQLAGTFRHSMDLFDPDGEYTVNDTEDRNAYDQPADLN